MKNETLLAFDYGRRYIGVAAGETVSKTASALTCIESKKDIPWEKIDLLIDEWQPDRIIIGNPLALNGADQPIVRWAKRFSNQIKLRYSLPVEWVDERFTTVEARSQLFDKHGFSGLKKEKVDALSAQIILQQWLNERKSE
ncbi:MAG TPA: Holliday junction resolvase RuvX [Gammaproteobacteria bacterium]|nr:Holliday junction resolvase RuvX [Gammaproteobacteria bacterium]